MILDKKNVLIIGGSSGIGLAVAKRARQEGAHVMVASRDAAEKIAALPEPLNTIEAHSFDINDIKSHEKLLGDVGAIDHLVIAVRPEMQSAVFQDTDIDNAKRAFDTKFWGPYQFIQNAHRHINEGGSIILTSGIAGEKIYPGFSIMALMNTATETLCRSLAVELSPLRVNCVSPGFVEPKPEAVQDYAHQFPINRLATMEEVTSAYLYLMTNPYVTGEIMVVDGGARLI